MASAAYCPALIDEIKRIRERIAFTSKDDEQWAATINAINVACATLKRIETVRRITDDPGRAQDEYDTALATLQDQRRWLDEYKITEGGARKSRGTRKVRRVAKKAHKTRHVAKKVSKKAKTARKTRRVAKKVSKKARKTRRH